MSAVVNTVPDQQPDGGAGIGIQNFGALAQGEAPGLFSGQPAKSMSGQKELITAAIAPEYFSEAGKKRDFQKAGFHWQSFPGRDV